MNAAAILVGLLLPLTLLLIAVVKSARVWRGRLSGCAAWKKAAAMLALCTVALFGGEKGGTWLPPEIVEILSWRSEDGGLNDVSGRVVSGIQLRALEDFVEKQDQIVDAASNVIEQARADCAALTNRLLTTDYKVVYVAYDLPRGMPSNPNHNIMVNWEKVEQTTSNITCYAWFSQMPTTNVAIHAQYAVSEGEYRLLSPIRDSWPETFTVGDVECVAYEYAIPPEIAGTVLRPEYEVRFGGYDPGQYLKVPESGVVVTTNGVDVAPFTGYKTFMVDTNSVSLRVVGGLVTELILNGTSFKGANPL